MKVRKVNYKKWLDFTDSDGNAQDFIVITGKSGAGKTNILRSIIDYHDVGGLCEFEDDGCGSILTFIHIDDFNLDDLSDLDIDRVNDIVKDFNLNVSLDRIHTTDLFPIFKTNNGNKEIESVSLSNSERRIYTQAIIYCKYQPKNTIILIDEPETSLHPSLQYKVVEMYKRMQREGDNQIVIATNSPEIVSCFKSDSVFALEDNGEEIKCYSMSSILTNTKGCEPNNILRSVFESPLRDKETNKRIGNVADLLRLHPDKVNEPENRELIEGLTHDLGRGDPMIMRMNHKLLMISRNETKSKINV